MLGVTLHIIIIHSKYRERTKITMTRDPKTKLKKKKFIQMFVLLCETERNYVVL